MNAKFTWKRVLNKEGELLMEGVIVDDSNLYVMDPAYFGHYEDASQVDLAIESNKDSATSAGVADGVEETEGECYYREIWNRGIESKICR